jgi:hypothetical protein
MNNVTKFLTLFSEFSLVVCEKEPKRPEPAKVNTANSGTAKSDLEKELKRLMQEYKRAQKSYKHNKISRQELFDFEWRIFELQEEIRRIEEDGFID